MKNLLKHEMMNVFGGGKGGSNSRIINAINSGSVDAIIHEVVERPV